PIVQLFERLNLPEVRATVALKQSAGAAVSVTGASANGYVVASRRAALSADTPGRIVELNVTEGSVVKKGDVVARLFSDEYRASLKAVQAEIESQKATIERVQAQLAASTARGPQLDAEVQRAQEVEGEQMRQVELSRSRLQRAEALLKDGFGAQQAVDDARSEVIRIEGGIATASAALRVAQATRQQLDSEVTALRAALAESQARLPVLEANREGAQATLEKTAVRAPFDGIVVLKDAEVGEVVSPNSVGGNARGSVATMVDFATLEVQVELPETNLSAAIVGDKATIFLDAYPDRSYAGSVSRIWPTANRQKATVEVRVRFDEPDDRLRPEMGARIVFGAQAPARTTETEAGESTVVVPMSAVVPIDGKPHVFLIERDIVRQRAVELGPEKNGRAIVRSGLAGGERLVDTPPATLADGDRIRVKG
ncbi:MAG: efflux RND transporter periplasmic adaptor subunit, partial [Planctomycetota bacterium]|nr:efflux RND transporter periplasmic adaptor subunit [Planctomycetota bacterium]